MGKRIAFLAVCLLGLLLAAPVAAAISLTTITPRVGYAESTIVCVVTGQFPEVQRPLCTLSPIAVGHPTIEGVTAAGWTVGAASVTFSLPSGSEGQYDLVVQQGTSWTAKFRAFLVGAPPIVLEALEPSSTQAGSPDLPLIVRGDHFSGADPLDAGASVIRWNDTDLHTTVVSKTLLRTTIPAALLRWPGVATITVSTPILEARRRPAAPGATVTRREQRGALTFTITAPTPTITALDPTSAVVGAAALDLGVTGTGFLSGALGAVVRWNGTDLATTCDSAAHLTAVVPASLLAAAASASITVRNGVDHSAPLSNALPFTVGNALPTVTTISPTQVWAGSVKSDLVLTVNGTGFLSGAHVMLGITEKETTTFVSATQLSVPLSAADIAGAGTVAVGVANPPFPPGVASVTTQPLAVQAETTDPTVTIAGADSAWHNRPVTLTFSGSDGQSGVQAVQYRCPPAVRSWTTESSYTVPVATQGAITVNAQALDWCNRVGSTSATVKIDTTAPTTDAFNAVRVKRKKIATLKFRIGEPADLSPLAKVVIKVKARGSNKLVRTKTLNSVSTNAVETCRFKVTFRKGSYRWYIYATDLAGNAQANIDRASFRVR